jgi:hypothetical protein
MPKADDAHYELLRMAVEIYHQNHAVGGSVAASTKETALHAVATARRAARTAKGNDLHALCDDAERKITGDDFRIALPAAHSAEVQRFMAHSQQSA